MTTELLNKLEKVIEDLYYDKRIISFTEKELADGTIEYTFVAKKHENSSKKPTKQKVVIKKDKTEKDKTEKDKTEKDKTEKDKTEKKESGPIKPPKPPMAEILSVGGY